MQPTIDDAEPTAFEAAMSRLEEVVRALESGQLPLGSSLALFQEGVGLARRCERLLDDTQARIELLLAGQDEGAPHVVPFPEGTE